MHQGCNKFCANTISVPTVFSSALPATITKVTMIDRKQEQKYFHTRHPTNQLLFYSIFLSRFKKEMKENLYHDNKFECNFTLSLCI